MTISDNVALVKEQLALAAREAGRDPSDIILLAASKMNDASRVREAFEAGIEYFGENRVQEMTPLSVLITARIFTSSAIFKKTRQNRLSASPN